MAGNATIRGVPRQLSNGGAPSVMASSASQIPTIQYSSGSAQALQSFARDMFSMSKQYEDQLDEQVQAEATVAGATAGASGSFEYQDYGTIRGRAFNRAAMETYATTLDTQAIGRLNEIRSQYWDDPDGQKAASESYINGVATELAKRDPAQAEAFRNRNLTRAMPGVEAAKDTRYALTRDEANAALVANEVALNAEIKDQASDLFSENPDRSRAAAKAIGLVQEQYLQVYNAKDPTTGKPLYSAVEIAKAKRDFMDRTMTAASLSWFEEQPDKSAAYLKFSSGDFAINLRNGGGSAKVIMANKGATRNDPIKETLKQQVSAAASLLGDDIQVIVGSGGQESAAEVNAGLGARTGSNRHDHGGAGDMRLARNGQILPFAQNRELYAKWAENAAAAGVTGIGVDEGKGYLHLGGGSQAAWGYGPGGGRGKYLPADFKDAIERGRAGPKLDYEPSNQAVKVRDTLPPEVLDRIDTEMRQRIGFANSQRDRAAAVEAKAIEAQQDLNSFDFMNRAASPQGLTREEITEGVRRGSIKPEVGEKLVRFTTTERPERSDEATRRLLMTRAYAGEDIRNDILDAGDKLAPSDFSQLMSLNQQRNVDKDSGLTEDQKFQQGQLEKLLTPDTSMAALDPNRQMRKFNGLNEYRQRITDPNETRTPAEIAEDIASRAFRDFSNLDQSELGAKVRPRFSVPEQGNPKYLDVRTSAIALKKAFDAKQISEPEYRRAQRELVDWTKLQDRVKANSTQKAK